jgi:phage protein D
VTRAAPFYSVELVQAGGATRLDLTQFVERFEYIDRERAADKLTLTVDNEDLSNFDDPVWKKGALLDVSWGYSGNAAPKRRVVIQSVVGARTLQVEALGQELLFASERRARTFEDATRSEVVAEIAREGGWSDELLDVQETTIRYGSIVQARRTDAEFIRRLAILEGFEWYVDFDGFHWHERRLGQRPTKVYIWHSDPGRGEVFDFEVENDVTARPGRVRVRGRDPLTGEDFEVEASNDAPSEANRDVLAPIAEVVDPESFLGILLDESTEPEARVAQTDVRATTSADAATAQREATARFRRAQQAAVKMGLTLIGDPGLLAKSVVECRNFGVRLSLRYYVREVTHIVDPQGPAGYECRVKLISDGHGGHTTESNRARGLGAFQVGPQSEGRQNVEEPVDGAEPQAEGGRSPEEGAALDESSRIDPETLEEITTWEDSRGRTRRSSPEG